MDEPIRFAKENREHGYLSNFWSSPFQLDGLNWPTVEHWYQANKFVNTDPKWFEHIRTVATPQKALVDGRSTAHPIRSDWETVRADVMLEGLRAKFFQNPDLAARLIATGQRELVEAANWEKRQGVGRAPSRSYALLGKLLMQVREELKSSRTPVVSRKEPVDLASDVGSSKMPPLFNATEGRKQEVMATTGTKKIAVDDRPGRDLLLNTGGDLPKTLDVVKLATTQSSEQTYSKVKVVGQADNISFKDENGNRQTGSVLVVEIEGRFLPVIQGNKLSYWNPAGTVSTAMPVGKRGARKGGKKAKKSDRGFLSEEAVTALATLARAMHVENADKVIRNKKVWYALLQVCHLSQGEFEELKSTPEEEEPQEELAF